MGKFEFILLIDGAFFKQKYKQFKNQNLKDAKEITTFTNNIKTKHCPGDELLRIYFYDCQPFSEKLIHPISGQIIDYRSRNVFIDNEKLLRDLKRTDYVAVREGQLLCNGWRVKQNIKPGQLSALNAQHISPEFKQKGVDIKIGLDIAWISFQRICNRVFLVTGDADFIPAMKLARRNGIQVFLFTLAHRVNDILKDHADKIDESDISTFL